MYCMKGRFRSVSLMSAAKLVKVQEMIYYIMDLRIQFFSWYKFVCLYLFKHALKYYQ